MKALVLGLGNPILSDDGVGLRVARALESRLDRPDVTVMEGSVAGLDFLDLLTGYDKAIIIDAIQSREGKVGQIYRLEPGAIDTTRLSNPHDVNLTAALELGRRLGLALPQEIVIFAIEVKDVTTFGEQCTPEVEQTIPVVTDMVVRELNGEKYACAPYYSKHSGNRASRG